MSDRPILSLKKDSVDPALTKDLCRNEKHKCEAGLAIQNTIDKMCRDFPRLFNKKHPKPLKIGILDDFLKTSQGTSKTRYRKALHMYTTMRQYQQAIINHANRYDLTGEACGEVTQPQKELALSKLNTKISKQHLNLEK